MECLPKRPKLRKIYLFPMGANRFLAKSMSELMIMQGKLVSDILPRLIPLMDGTHTLVEIVNILGDYDKEVITDVMQKLYEKGLLDHGSSESKLGLSPEDLKRYGSQLDFFSEFGDQYKFQRLLKDSRVVILGLGAIGSRVLTALVLSGVGHIIGFDSTTVTEKDLFTGLPFSLQDLGKPRSKALEARCRQVNPRIHYKSLEKEVNSVEDVSTLIEGCSLVILSNEMASPLTYEWVNEVCLDKKVVWTSCRIIGTEGLIGPSIIPYETPCYKCYDLRFKGNLEFYNEYVFLEEYLKANPQFGMEFGIVTPFADIVATFTAFEVIKILTGFLDPVTYGKVLLFDFLTMQTKLHKILKLPRCPACGRPSKRMPKMKIWMG